MGLGGWREARIKTGLRGLVSGCTGRIWEW